VSEREAPVPTDLSPEPGAPVPADLSPAPGAAVPADLSPTPGNAVPADSRAAPVPTDSPRIVDLVFAPGRAAPRRRLPAALIAGLAHLALGVWIVGMQPSLEAWSADLASRIHDELTRVEIVELAPPKPAEPSPVAAPPPPAPDTTPSATPPPSEPAPRVRLKVGAAPARAGKIVSAPGAPLDLTGEVFVEGQGSAYAGGATSPGGTGTTPTKQVGAPPPAASPTPTPSKPSRAAPVSLPTDEWNCPWPDEASELPIDEQTATIRVTVRADGSVESSTVVQDPGDGFAAAAIRCARRTRFTPAKDPEGRPIRAVSPPIRLHFYR